MSGTWVEQVPCECGYVSKTTSSQRVIGFYGGGSPEARQHEYTAEWYWATKADKCGGSSTLSMVDKQNATDTTRVSAECNKTWRRTSGIFPDTYTYVSYGSKQIWESSTTRFSTDSTYIHTQTMSRNNDGGRRRTFASSTTSSKAWADYVTKQTTTEHANGQSTYTCEKLVVSGTTTSTGDPVTFTKCPLQTTTQDTTRYTRPTVTNLEWVSGCIKKCVNIYNEGEEDIVLVRVRDGLDDDQMVFLRDAVEGVQIPPRADPVKHCWDTTTASGFLDLHEHLGGEISALETRSTYDDGRSVVTQSWAKVYPSFAVEEIPWGATKTAKLSQIATTTDNTVEAFKPNGDTFSLTITALKQETIEYNQVDEDQIESTWYNTGEHKTVASVSGIDFWNGEASVNKHSIIWGNFTQEFINVEWNEDWGQWDWADDNTRVITKVGAGYHVSELPFVKAISYVRNGIKVKTNENFDNCSADHNYETVDAVYSGGHTTYLSAMPHNGFQQYGTQLYDEPYDGTKIFQGQPECQLYEFYTVAYPAYQDIYAVGTGGMMFAKLNAEFSSTLLGNISATANSALQRVTAYSVPVTITKADGQTARTTQIDVGNTKESFTTRNETTTLEETSVNKLIHFHTAMTLAYFSQKEYTATSWADVQLDTIDSGFKIIRDSSTTYTSDNYDPEAGNCHIHTFMKTAGIQPNGVFKAGGVLQDGSPRSYYLLVKDNGLPCVGKVVTFTHGCSHNTQSSTFSEGVHTLTGTQVSMIATDVEVNVGALKKALGTGRTMTPEQYEVYKYAG